MRYSASVHTAMTIDEKNNNVALNEFDVRTSGYRNKDRLDEAKRKYNSGEEIPEKYNIPEYHDWRNPIWYRMYFDMIKRLERWKTRRA